MQSRLYFTDLHVNPFEQAQYDRLLALAELSKREQAYGVTAGDNIDAHFLMQAHQELGKAAEEGENLPEEEKQRLMQQLQSQVQQVNTVYTQLFSVVDQVYGNFHEGVVYGVRGNNEHPGLMKQMKNFVSLEGRLEDVGGVMHAGIQHTTGDIFGTEESVKNPFYNVDTDIVTYGPLLKEADMIVMHEGAHPKLAGDLGYHEGLGEIVKDKHIFSGHIHSPVKEEENGKLRLRGAPNVAYLQSYNDETQEWDTYAVDVDKLVEMLKEEENPVIGKVGPAEEPEKVAA